MSSRQEYIQIVPRKWGRLYAFWYSRYTCIHTSADTVHNSTCHLAVHNYPVLQLSSPEFSAQVLNSGLNYVGGKGPEERMCLPIYIWGELLNTLPFVDYLVLRIVVRPSFIVALWDLRIRKSIVSWNLN